MPPRVSVARARWEVVWRHNGRLIRKDCGEDLPEALRVQELATSSGRKAVTLRSKNVAFPPPEKFADTEEVPIGRSKRTRKIVYETRTVEPRRYLVKMRRLNARGIWWCPFCMKLRRFEKRKGYKVEGVYVDDTHLACPICGITHRHGSVLKYNPIAVELAMRQTNRRRNRRTTRRRKEENE